jgi:HlyD family secretion protein
MANHEQGPASGQALSDRVRSLRLGDRPGERRGGRGGALPWAIAFVLLLTTTAFGYRAYRVGSLTPEDLERLREGAAAQPASTDTTPGSFTGSVAGVGEVVLQQKGYITPISLIQVSPKVGGQLVWLSSGPGQPVFEEGAFFRKGQLLARLERDDYEFEHQQAASAYQAAKRRYEEIKKTQPDEVKQAKAELEEATKTGTQLKLDVERNKRLTMSSALAQREAEQTRYAHESNAARIAKFDAGLQMILRRQKLRLQAAEFEMNQAEAMKKKARWRLDNTEIVAPVTGTILTKKAELGNIVNPSAFSSGISASLCEMADLTRLEVDLSVQERDIVAIKVGQPCRIMPEAYANDKDGFLARHPQGYTGRVSRLMPTADRAKGAIPVRVVIDVPEAEAGVYLRPDMGALVSFLKAPEKKGASPKAEKKEPKKSTEQPPTRPGDKKR